MAYEAILLSYNGEPDKDPSKGGFKTELDAWDYVETFRCNLCKQEEIELENNPEYDASFACDAEWMVVKQELL